MRGLDASAATTKPVRIDVTVAAQSVGLRNVCESVPVTMPGARSDRKYASE